MRLALHGAAIVAAGLLSTSVLADAQFGTAAEAKAMLQKAVAEMKKDPNAAIAKFNDPNGGFRDRDLYPFCATMDGKTTAHVNPAQVGANLKELKDKKGKAFGAQMFKVAKEGKVSEVSYMWPRPGSEKPVAKESYVTKVGDQICGVGFYK